MFVNCTMRIDYRQCQEATKMNVKRARGSKEDTKSISGNVSSISATLHNLCEFMLALVHLLLRRQSKLERLRVFVAVERMDRASDYAEEFRELRRTFPGVALAAGVERERGYGGVVPTQPHVRLVEGEQEAAIQDGDNAMEEVRGESQ